MENFLLSAFTKQNGGFCENVLSKVKSLSLSSPFRLGSFKVSYDNVFFIAARYL